VTPTATMGASSRRRRVGAIGCSTVSRRPRAGTFGFAPDTPRVTLVSDLRRRIPRTPRTTRRSSSPSNRSPYRSPNSIAGDPVIGMKGIWIATLPQRREKGLTHRRSMNAQVRGPGVLSGPWGNRTPDLTSSPHRARTAGKLRFSRACSRATTWPPSANTAPPHAAMICRMHTCSVQVCHEHVFESPLGHKHYAHG
jgi:hypothetical protein